MRALLILVFVFLALAGNAQVSNCYPEKLTFKINPNPESETIGDLVLSKNSGSLYLGMYNLITFNKKLPEKKIIVSGAELCTYEREKSYLLRPISQEVIFKYFHKGDTITRKFEVSPVPFFKLDFWFGDRRFYNHDTLTYYNPVDSLSAKLDLEGDMQWLAKEDFQLYVSSLDIYLVRGGQTISEIHGKAENAIFIGNMMNKAQAGDQIKINYAFQVLNSRSVIRNTSYKGDLNIQLGNRE